MKDICFPTEPDRASPALGSSHPGVGQLRAKEAPGFGPLSVGVTLPRRGTQHEESPYPYRKQSEHTTKDYVAESSLDGTAPVTRHPQYSLRHQSAIETE